MDEDEYTGIFDDISPQDFIVETTAIAEMSRTNHGVDAFNSFTEEQLRSIRTAYLASQGEFQPIALLANEHSQRIFAPDDEETVGEFVKRLHREAQSMNAVWTFVSIKTMVGTTQSDADDPDAIHDVNDPEVARELIAAGKVADGLVWYAERREGDERHRRQGIMVDQGQGRLGPITEGPALQSFPLFALILS